MEKRDLIVFPHRIAPEKQPEIFRDLADSMKQYEFIICQEHVEDVLLVFCLNYVDIQVMIS